MPKKQTNHNPPEAQDIIQDMNDQEALINNEEDQLDEQAETEEALSELEAMQLKLEEAHAKADEYLDGWQRARAEFANYKKRVDRDQLQLRQTVKGNVLKHYLSVLDDLERALKNRPQEGDGAAWAEGIDLIYRKLLTVIENEGVTPMQAEGTEFDPTLHEAVTSEDSDQYESGQIIEVIQQGYLMGEKILRPAMVRVAR